MALPSERQVAELILWLHKGGQSFPASLDPDKGVALYFAACKDIPTIAVRRAASRFHAGAVEGFRGDFIPTPAQFAQVARYEARVMSADVARIRLSHEAIKGVADMRRKKDPASVARVRDMVATFKRGQSSEAGDT